MRFRILNEMPPLGHMMALMFHPNKHRRTAQAVISKSDQRSHKSHKTREVKVRGA